MFCRLECASVAVIAAVDAVVVAAVAIEVPPSRIPVDSGNTVKTERLSESRNRWS